MTASVMLHSGTLPAAIGSLVSLGAQVVMALFLLGLFEPQAVGEFSVMAQVAFGWATLGLAQSQISLLANHHLPTLPAARAAWRNAMQRALCLSPVAALALWWSGTGWQGTAIALLWTGAMAGTQMTWWLSQSLTLRLQQPWPIAMVRMVPPLLAAILVALAAVFTGWRDSAALATAALVGYAAGAMWLLPALRDRSTMTINSQGSVIPGDSRSERLKFLHALSDVGVATLLATHWSGIYGASQAGCLLVLLRVMGFIPALISTAWAQVLMSHPQGLRSSSTLAASLGAAAVALAGMLVGAAVQGGWLSGQWASLQPYLLPLVLWQGAATVMAAVSHRPFAQGRTRQYTHQCLAINAVQALLLLLPPLMDVSLSMHLWGLCGAMTLALLGQALWAMRLSEPASRVRS